ncbi:MAG: monofunctional biosynthetic peptidoglycan transglycosylase [Alphaproteobacteria bacterium]|nr:monofunctional biosynthetic peptidoglycan transglycosylase [Alphaproteobacteria bacterium]
MLNAVTAAPSRRPEISELSVAAEDAQSTSDRTTPLVPTPSPQVATSALDAVAIAAPTVPVASKLQDQSSPVLTTPDPSPLALARPTQHALQSSSIIGDSVTTGSTGSWIERVWTTERQAAAKRWGWFAVYGFAAWFVAVTVLTVIYRFVNPPASNLMLYHYLVGREVHQSWVPLEKISPHVIKAVVVAEDAQFCRHWGIDFGAIEEAIENAGDGTPRGASTISMQTAKNLFLWNSKSYFRKALEVPVTLMMELIWPKRRMLEVYLNIAEWGPGIFGIGAAARHHFKTSPANLGAQAAARLAASLPNPKIRRAGRPGPKTRRKANVIQGRARQAVPYTGCVLG